MRSLVLVCLIVLLAAAPANAALSAAPTEPAPLSVSITLGKPQQLFHVNKPDALGMKGVPDQPLTPILQPGSDTI